MLQLKKDMNSASEQVVFTSNKNGILREYQAYDLVEFILRCVQMMLFVSYINSLL